MARTNLSDVERTSRDEMSLASKELAQAMRELAKRLDELRPSPSVARSSIPTSRGETKDLALRAERLGVLFDRLELESKNEERSIPLSNLRTMGRLFEEMSTKVIEISELVGPDAVAVEQMGQKFGRIAELVGQALLLADVRLS